jgi:DNA-binding MarR family transcriptional regulator
MSTSEQTANQFVQLLRRFIRVRPKLVFPDEHVASLRQQMQDLRNEASSNPEDRWFLFRIMEVLTRSETPPTMGELGAELGIPLSSATRMADGLVRAKFAQRCADKHDRRIVRLCLTDHGRQFIEMGMDHMKRQMVQLLDHLSSTEQDQLLRLITKLIDSAQAQQQ